MFILRIGIDLGVKIPVFVKKIYNVHEKLFVRRINVEKSVLSY